MKELKNWFITKFSPLQQLLLLGLIFRLISVIFSKGFAWHDDHFLIIESSQSWVDGYFNFWLPTEAEPNRDPQGHALFYIGLHFYLFKFFKLIGLMDPQVKMMIVRLFHALWSLLIISFGYKTALQYSNKKVAWYVGLFLSLFWFMPFVSVRNLVEFVCVPPLLIAIYRLGKENPGWKDYVMAGLWLGIAFSIRFQSVFIAFGIGIALLILKRPFKLIALMTLVFFGIIFLTQGLVDYIIWKRPFAEFMAYVEYNLNNATAYGTDNWHMYFDLIFGLLVPPLSFLIFAGYCYTWKKIPLLFWPVFFYLAFHTYFPNKQERFVMTILPLIIVSGTVGMFFIYEKYRQKFSQKWLRISKLFVVSLNVILLIVLSFSSSKSHRVDAMYYLYKKNDAVNFMIEDSNKENDFLLPPQYYFGKWVSNWGINKTFTPDSALVYYNAMPTSARPNYVVFWQAENIDERVNEMKKRFPTLTYDATIEPSFIDKTLYFLNPYNDNQTAYIYKIK